MPLDPPRNFLFFFLEQFQALIYVFIISCLSFYIPGIFACNRDVNLLLKSEIWLFYFMFHFFHTIIPLFVPLGEYICLRP